MNHKKRRNQHRKMKLLAVAASCAALNLPFVTASAHEDHGPSTNKFSIQGGWLNLLPDSDAREYARECVDCSDTSNINDGANVRHHKSDFSDFAGGLKWTHLLDDTTDFAIGVNFGQFKADQERFSPLYQQDGNIGTPYGTVDSSSTGAGGTNQDKAKFLTGDFEYGWTQSTDHTNLRMFVGARSEYFDWKRTADQDLSSSNVYSGDETSKFYGIGPRVGMSYDSLLGNSEVFGLFGGLSGGVMGGKLKQKFKTDSSSTDDGSLDNYSKTTAVPFADAEAGVFVNVAGGVTLQMGYQAGYAHNIMRTATVCTDDNADDTKANNDSCGDERSGVLTHGAFLRLTGRF